MAGKHAGLDYQKGGIQWLQMMRGVWTKKVEEEFYFLSSDVMHFFGAAADSTLAEKCRCVNRSANVTFGLFFHSPSAMIPADFHKGIQDFKIIL